MANTERNKRNISESFGSNSKKSILDELSLRTDLTKKEEEKLRKWRKSEDEKQIKNTHLLMREYEKKRHAERTKELKEEGKVFQAWWNESFGSLDSFANTLGNVTKSLTSQIDKSLDNYIAAQQAMAAHLAGSNNTFSSLTNTLQSTLGSSNFVKQEQVFNNLTNLVKSGITYNVEQRAFLQTIAKDIDSVFNATNGSLTQLIRLQNRDLSANRLAIEYSLQKFLNQNYQTSEYIRHGFTDVSNSLLAAQSTMETNAAVAFEAAVQGQLGSMYSAGFNESTVTGLAQAINALGSGQIPTGGGLSNLVLMAAARAGLDYGTLLNQGLNAQTTNAILSNITGYLAEMGENQSNVVRSQLGNLFGVSITDIMAAQNVKPQGGYISTDISTLFGDYEGFLTSGTRLQNMMDNLMFTFGTNIASNENRLKEYEITRMIANSGLGNLLYGVGDSLPFASTALKLAGIAANNAQLIPIILSIFGENGTWADIKNSWSSRGDIGSAFKNLGSSLSGSTVKISGAGVSGGMYISSTGTGDLLSGSTSSLTDIASSVTTVESDKATIDENVEAITLNVILIHEILDTYVGSINDSITNIADSLNIVSGWRSITGASI